MPLNPAALCKAEELLASSKNILIIPHANVDPDGLSAALACYLLFTRHGMKCTVLCPETLPESLAFLPGYDQLEASQDISRDCIITLNGLGDIAIDDLRYTIEDTKINIILSVKRGTIAQTDIPLQLGPFPYDCIVAVDTAEPKLFGPFYQRHRELFDTVPIINIDHHVSNSQYGDVRIIDTSASSATQVLFEWFRANSSWKSSLTPDIATLLLTGLITDTRSFQNPNTTPHAMEIAADLIDLGARQQEIIQRIYKTKPLSTLRIWGRALNRIQISREDRIAWTSISREDLEEMESSSKETHGIIDEFLTTISDVDLYLLFTELEEGGMKVSVRSTEALDASVLCSKIFGGGGHPRAAGFRIPAYENFQLATLQAVQQIAAEVKHLRGGASPSKPNDPVQGDGIDIVHALTQG